MSIHTTYMKRALELAKKGRYATSPNPMVGACVVKKGRLISEGFHAHFGGPHAEVNALKKAGKRAKGATLYVSLEPCSTWGKTGPCTEVIKAAGIKEVVIGVLDPNPKNRRKGIQELKRAKIRVRNGCLTKESKQINAPFFKLATQNLPFVTLKMAQTMDGKIATSHGSSRWITSSKARNYVHQLRAEHDAILVGKNTLLLDNPKLSPRIKIKNQDASKPWRVVIDPKLELPKHARIYEGKQLTFFAVSEKNIKKIKTKGNRSHILIPVGEKKGQLDLKELLKDLASLGVCKLLVEGGGETAWSLLKEGLVDRLVWFVAPKIIGGKDAKTSVEGEGFHHLSKAIHLKNVQSRPIGEDWLFEAEVEK